MDYLTFAFGFISGISLILFLYALSTWILRVQEESTLKQNKRAKFYTGNYKGRFITIETPCKRGMNDRQRR